jgi:hypothetical protein
MRTPRPFRWIGEQMVDISRNRSFGLAASWTALRSMFNVSFFHKPVMDGSTVNYDVARGLYRNDNPAYNLGAGFVRPIVDLTVEYMGVPSVTSDNGDTDAWLNTCIQEHWAAQLQQVWRDAVRDSKTIVRYRQPRLDNPLFTEEDRAHGKLECVPPETVDLQFDPTDPDLVRLAGVNHWLDLDQRSDDEIASGVAPRMETHHIIETITPEEYRYYDKTESRELTSWRTANVFGFVPLWPCYNEYDVALGGGQSDIEPVLPFIQAFHEVLLQALGAHKYHSTPKAYFKLKDIYPFLKHNFPAVLDANNQIIPNAKVELTGREIYLLNVDEEAGFIEAKSVLGDSKTLLEFLIDCICITAEVPKWAILKDQGAQDKDATVQPFEKKINRKRVNFAEFVVMVCKLALAASSKTPVTVKVTWPQIRLTDLAAKAQAFQQLVLAGDVSAAHEWVADETMIQILSGLFPEINEPSVEQQLAKKNIVPAAPAPAPASPTQGSQQPSQNGNVPKSTAKKALTTTSASQS